MRAIEPRPMKDCVFYCARMDGGAELVEICEWAKNTPFRADGRGLWRVKFGGFTPECVGAKGDVIQIPPILCYASLKFFL